MIRTQISLTEPEYSAAKREAERLGISLAELLRRSLRTMIPADEAKPWMRTQAWSSRVILDRAGTSTTLSMGKRTDAYIGTSAFIAFVDRSDTWVLRRYDRTRALQFLSMIEDMKPLEIVPVGTAEQAGAAAAKIFRSRPHTHRCRGFAPDASAESQKLLVNRFPPRTDGRVSRR